MEVTIELIKPSPYQPRLFFDIDDLKREIQRDGLLSPLIVRRRDNFYELIDGERRLRTVKELGWTTVQVEVKDIDDRTARRSIFKLNKIRENYTVEEEAKYYKKLADEGMTAWEISEELGVNFHWVLANLNVFKFPEDIQKIIFTAGQQLTVSHIQELERVIARNIDDAVAWVRTVLERKLKSDDVRKLVQDQEAVALREALEKERLRKAQAELPEIPVVLESPDDLERAAKALMRQARRKRDESLTTEEKARIESEKQERQEQAKKRREEARKRDIEEEARKRAEEIIKDTNFIREFVDREYVLAEDIRAEDLKDALMQKLMSNIPEEKRQRAAEIFNEEFNSLQKRLEIFPEKSIKIEPKFTRFKELVARGVIPYTVWDFPERDDYAGDKDFHGNCSPQIVEQCIWRLTEEGDLVVDPMAGSGTALDVCRAFNRSCIGYDIKPLPEREDIVQNDSRNIPLEDDSVDMIFIHPPYWKLTYFTKAEERLPDLSRANTLEQFLNMLMEVFQECFRVLKRGEYMCVLLGDLIREGRFIPLCRRAANLAEEIGFMDYGYAVKLAHGEVSRKKSGVIVAEPLYTDNLKISHDLVMFFRKPL